MDREDARNGSGPFDLILGIGKTPGVQTKKVDSVLPLKWDTWTRFGKSIPSWDWDLSEMSLIQILGK